MNDSRHGTSTMLKVPHFENKPCYNCGNLERGICNFFDELFIIHCHKCNTTIARGFFNTDSIEVFDSKPEDDYDWEIEKTNKALENAESKRQKVK